VRTALPLMAWGVALALLAVALLAWSGDAEGPWLMLALAAAACIATGLAVAYVAPRSNELRMLPDISISPTVVAFGLLLVLVATAAGRWLVLVGGGVMALGIGGVVREHRAQRRERGR
jgi:uncharacterized membrane protein YidH (DUF202 family)